MSRKRFPASWRCCLGAAALTATLVFPIRDSLAQELKTAADHKPHKVKIAVLGFRPSKDVPSELAAALTNEISRELDALGPFHAISTAEINQMLAFEKIKDQLGCDDVACLVEIGGALGTEYLVTGSALVVTDTYVIQLQLMNISQSRSDARISREYSGGPKGLFEEVRTATKLLVRGILAKKSGSLHATTQEDGATVRVDGNIVGVSPLPPIQVAGGMHTVAVEKDGFVIFTRDVEIHELEETSVDALLVPSEAFLRDYEARAGLTRIVAWVNLGVGGASLAAGTALFLVSNSKAADLRADMRAYNASNQRTSDDLHRLNSRNREIGTLDAFTVATGLVGLVATGVGAFLYFNGDDPHRYDAIKSMAAGHTQVSKHFVPRTSVSPAGFVFVGDF